MQEGSQQPLNASDDANQQSQHKMTNPLAQPVLNPLQLHLLPEQSPSFDSLSPSSLQSPFKTNYGPGAQTLLLNCPSTPTEHL